MEETGEVPVRIEDLVAAVGYWRAILARTDGDIATREARFKEENAALYIFQNLTRQSLTEAEAQLRTAVVNAYIIDNTRQAHPACSIRITRQLHYDLAAATAWARTSAPALLVLDEKEFKKQAAQLDGAPVEMMEVPSAVIAGNLAPWTAALGLPEC